VLAEQDDKGDNQREQRDGFNQREAQHRHREDFVAIPAPITPITARPAPISLAAASSIC
jgi:hypothetical protein